MNQCQRMLNACDPPLSEEARREVWDQVKALEFHRGPMTPGLRFVVFPLVALFFSCPFLIILSKVAPYALFAGAMVVAVALLWCWRFAYVNAMKNRLELSRLLRARGVRVHLCGRCGYDLRAIERDNCPECGEQIAARQV